MNINKMNTKQLQKIENEQIKVIEKEGLVRWVVHRKFDDPQPTRSLYSHRMINALGITSVHLYENTNPAATGSAICSISESGFNRRIGRIVATGRALRDLRKKKKEH